MGGTTSDATDLELMRATQLLDTNPAAAARQAGAILAQAPQLDAAILLLAAARRRLGDAASAVHLFESMALAHPGSALMQLEYGRSLAACGRCTEAEAAVRRAIDLDDSLADGWREMATLRLLAGDVASADSAYLRYRTLACDPPELADAYVALDQERLDAAEQITQQRLREGVDEVAAYTLLAAIAARRGDELTEETCLNRILRRAPCDGTAREQLSKLLLRQSRTDEALPLIERLLASRPGSRAFLVLKAEALRLAEHHAEGLAIIDSLMAEQADDPELRLLAGNLQRYMGRTDDAIDSYRQAIQLRPGYGMAWWALSNLKTISFSAGELQAMRQAAAAARAGDDAVGLDFALGAALEDRAEFAAAFEHYARANRRARAAFQYDPAATTAFVQRFRDTFTARFFAERDAWGHADADPIFIVGLPRSGSTLLEQILASHSAVEGTRELPYIPRMARELAGGRETARRYPEVLASLGKREALALAERYLTSAQAHRRVGKRRFVDKMHGNFASIGLIHLLFPRAAIIDARRHPMGCAFACYKQLFNPGMNFAYELTELGAYYRDYAALMAHVDAVLPGRVYRVHYERLVGDTEHEVRRLLDGCGLPFEAGCLRFHENPRVAQTISSEQVRRPIYADGVDQWRHFEPWLGPLRAALGELVD